MKAIIVATEAHKDCLVAYGRATCLLPLGDRPILFHIIEELSRSKIQNIDLLLYNHAHSIRQQVGNGSRWGVSITTHLVKDPAYPLSVLRPLLSKNTEPVVVGNGSVWVSLAPLLQEQTEKKAPFTLQLIDEKNKPTPWFRTTAASLKANGTTNETIVKISGKSFSTNNFCSFFTNTQKLLSGNLPTCLQPYTCEVEPGVWLGRSVMIDPSTTLIPPIYVGSNTHICSGARIGPYVYIESDSIIDKDSHCEHTAILRHSFIGQGLDFSQSVIDRNVCYKKNHNTIVSIHDKSILADLTTEHLTRSVKKYLDRFGALCLLTLSFPIWMYLLCRYGLKSTEKILLPAPDEPAIWKKCRWVELNGSVHPVLAWLPRLFNVVAGRAEIVGISPRNAEDLANLSEDWRAQILPSVLGSLSPQEALGTVEQDPMQQYIAESYYVAHKNFLEDLKMVIHFLKRKK